MNMLRALLHAIDQLSLWSGRLVAALVPVMVLALSYEVISRYFFDAPTLWAQDVAVFVFGYVGLVGGAYVMRERAHINVDLFYARMRPRTKALCDSVTGAVALFFLVLVVVYGWRETLHAWTLNQHRPTDWAPVLAPFIFAICLGGGLLLLQTFAWWVRNLHVLFTGRPLDQEPTMGDLASGEPRT
jgi:TRAP-type C4-dicarboxylate transport system permease small subunit